MSDVISIDEVIRIVEQIDIRLVEPVQDGEYNDLLEDCRAHEYGPGQYWKDLVAQAFRWLYESSGQ